MPTTASSTGGTMSFQGRPAKDHGQAGSHHQQRGAQIGLLHDQAHGHHQQHKGDDKVRGAQIALAALEPPGQHQRRGDLQKPEG